VVSSSQKKRKRRAKTVVLQPKGRAGAIVNVRDGNAVPKTTIQTSAVTTQTTRKKKDEKYAIVAKARVEALVGASVVGETSSAAETPTETTAIGTWRTQNKDRVKYHIFHHLQRPNIGRTIPRNMLPGQARMTTDQHRPSLSTATHLR
jgi:hypothetical protein